MLNKQLIVESERMIIVNGFTFSEAEVRMILIVVILRYESYLSRSKTVNDGAGYGCFSRAGAAGDTNDEHVIQ